MNVEIDWSISDDEAEFPPLPEETAPAGPSLRSGWRRLGLVLAALAFLIAGGAFAVRAIVEDGQRRLETSLRDAVALEIGAIRAEDRELFLSFQDPTDSAWVSTQGSAFYNFRQFGIVPHEVIGVEMGGDRAWVDVHMTASSGRLYLINTWAYRRLDDGWRHTRLEESWWGRRTILQSGSVKVLFFARDEATAHDLLGRSLNWLYHACNDFGCNGLPSLTIDITHSLSLPPTVTWIGPNLISFPSPRRGWGQPGGLPPEGAVEELARQLARKVIYSRPGLDQFGPAFLAGDARPILTLAEQAAAWEASKWGIGAAPASSNYVAALAAQYGPSAVRSLIATLGHADDVESALTVALDTSLTALDRSPDFFVFLLNAEAEAIRRRDKDAFQAMQDPNIAGWTRVQQNRYDRSETWLVSDGEILDRFRRRSTNDRLIVMRVRLTGSRGAVERLESFRWARNRWLHTWPAFEAWGEQLSQEDGVFRVVYHERDADLVRPLIPRLNGLSARIASDLGRPVPSRPLTVTIDPVALGFQGLPDLVVPSPWTMGLPVSEDGGSAFLQRQIVALMAHSLAWKDAPAEMSLSQEAALSALVEWEVRSVLGEPILDVEAQSGLQRALSSGRLLPLNILWTTPVIVRPSFGQPELLGWPLARAEWLTLIDYIVALDDHGLPALLDDLLTSTSMEGWLQRSLGMSLADVDAGWRAMLSRY